MTKTQGSDVILFSGKNFPDRLALFLYFVKDNFEKFPEGLFLHSNVYYMRAALQKKFDRFFSVSEVYDLIQDKSWQWRKPLQLRLKEIGLKTHVSQ